MTEPFRPRSADASITASACWGDESPSVVSQVRTVGKPAVSAAARVVASYSHTADETR